MNYFYKPWTNGEGFVVINRIKGEDISKYKLTFFSEYIKMNKDWKPLYDSNNIPMKLLCKTNLGV